MTSEESSRFRLAWWLLLIVPTASAGIACLANPCLHGICIDDINSTYACYCIDGYTGVQCQTNWDECWSDPCQNGGTCIDGVAAYNCSCPDGFIGDNCETNYNECESNPCLNNGTCIDLTNEYVCHCSPGFSGDHCEIDVAVCNSTEEIRCYNGGECIEGTGFKFYCKCLPGWTGVKCEDQIDECESNPCENGGVCIDMHADYMCACTYGYTGKSCEVQIEFCDENSCSNDALCVIEDGVRMCYCVPDFHGERCELQYDECLLGPRCMNGGTCIDGVDNFTCSCPPRLTGALCECLILDDGSYDCEYVSPTPYYNVTQSVTFSTLYEDLTSITSATVTDKPTDTDFVTPVEASTEISGNKSFTQTQIEGIVTTESSKGTDSTVPMILTTESVVSTTEQIEDKESTTLVIVTLPTQGHESIGTEDSKMEVTTECSDVCIKSNISTSKFPTSKELDSTTQGQHTEVNIFTSPTGKDVTEVNLTTSTIISIPKTSVKETEEDITTVKVVTDLGTDVVSTETSSTVRFDITTEKMFTNVPTDQSSIALPTLPITTEPVGTITGLDVTTHSYTSVPSECTNSVCHNHGTCITGLHGTRCHCLFNFGGRFCEEKILINTAAFNGNSYIAHHLTNTSWIDIEFNAKTLITDGQMMHVDIAKGVYMELYMNMGLLKFKFSCGYQTMLLSELKTYVNKGYLMKIETRLDLYLNEQHCNATLRLNDTVAMSGGQVANISILDRNATLYFGNKGNHSEYKPFVGCISDLLVNGEKREVFGDAFDASEVSECSSLSCLSAPCLNGGSCSDRGDSYVCSCANGWMGNHCNQSVCEHNPCQSGGSCVRHAGSGFLCLCPYGKHGIFCEYNVEITRPSLAPISTGVSAFVLYPLSAAALASDRFDLRLRFQTADMDQIALLAFVGQHGRHDSRSPHLALTFVKGYLMLTWNLGNGPRRIFTSRPLSYRRGGHGVRVWRRGRAAGLSVDGRHNVSGNAPALPGHDAKMTVLPYIYIGGHPSRDFRSLPHDLPLHGGWRGCVWEVGGQALGAGAPAGRGVGQCGVAQCTARSCNAPRGVCIHSPATYGCICTEGWFGATCAAPHGPCDPAASRCRGRCVLTAGAPHCDCPYGKTGPYCDQELIPLEVQLSGRRSFLALRRRSVSSVSLALEAELRPAGERGLVVFVQTPHFFSALSLQGSLLEYRWTDRLSGLTSLVRSGVVVSLAQWHSVRAGRYGSRLYVWVDGALATEPMLAHAYPHTASDATIVLGGAKDLASLPFDVMSGPVESYAGCIRNFHINNIPLALEPQNIEEGQNVQACEGAACGGEGGTSGARCRRGACAGCVPPAGRCRAARCVCAAGRAGDHCQHHINITIPQFDGDALIALSRGGREQSLRSGAAAPPHVAFNFTTADPNGLLSWTTLDSDYIGLALEDGYIRLAWSLHCDTHTVATRNSSRLLPQAGFLADGEWHAVLLNLTGRNMTLALDQAVIYHVEMCSNNLNRYENVEVYIGGAVESTASAKQIFPQNFKGCIDHISTNTASYLTDYTNVYSENIKSCQWFPPPG